MKKTVKKKAKSPWSARSTLDTLIDNHNWEEDDESNPAELLARYHDYIHVGKVNNEVELDIVFFMSLGPARVRLWVSADSLFQVREHTTKTYFVKDGRLETSLLKPTATEIRKAVTELRKILIQLSKKYKGIQADSDYHTEDYTYPADWKCSSCGVRNTIVVGTILGKLQAFDKSRTDWEYVVYRPIYKLTCAECGKDYATETVLKSMLI